jgi:hypothetical protein
MIFFALIGVVTATSAISGPSTGPQILYSDVTRFYEVYDAAAGHPTVEQLDRDYLDHGTEGLHEFAKLRNVTGARIASTIAAHPETYTNARRCLEALPAVRGRLMVSFATLARLYPEAKFPPVTIVVGRGRPVGITSPSGVDIGLEALCATDYLNPSVEDRFVHVIAHEYGHIQQPAAIQQMEAGDPGVTLLKKSLIEGTAEFIAELISGDIGNQELRFWTKGKEPEIDAAFIRDQDKTDLSAWIDNGPGDAAHPSDLGYWVGYRIVKSFYARAPDKHEALKEIFEMKDPKAFLAKSGWQPEEAKR